jgi:hypothetical protein
MSQEPEKQSKGTQWLSILVVVIALAIVAYFVIRAIWSFLWWIVAFMALALLLVNRKMVMKIVNYIRGMYKKNKVLGVAGILGSVVAFTPFMGFLLLKTIWDFTRPSLMKQSAAKAGTGLSLDDKMPIEMTEPKGFDDTSFLDKNPLKDNSSKFPPTEQ